VDGDAVMQTETPDDRFSTTGCIILLLSCVRSKILSGWLTDSLAADD
jgi:hypothetical protein